MNNEASTPLRFQAEDLYLSFGATDVLRGLNLDVTTRSLALIGPSGSGKSTFLRVLGGLVVPDSGHLYVGDEEVPREEPALRAYRKRLGYVFQDGELFHHMTVYDNIALPLKVVHGLDSSEADHRTEELLERLSLDDVADRYPVQISGGQRQRAAIARALAARPELVLLDEPTSALDPELTTEVLDILRRLIQNGTRTVIVTHEMGFARHACESAAFLYDGRILESAASDTLFSHPDSPQLQRFLAQLLEWSM